MDCNNEKVTYIATKEKQLFCLINNMIVYKSEMNDSMYV